MKIISFDEEKRKRQENEQQVKLRNDISAIKLKSNV